MAFRAVLKILALRAGTTEGQVTPANIDFVEFNDSPAWTELAVVAQGGDQEEAHDGSSEDDQEGQGQEERGQTDEAEGQVEQVEEQGGEEPEEPADEEPADSDGEGGGHEDESDGNADFQEEVGDDSDSTEAAGTTEDDGNQEDGDDNDDANGEPNGEPNGQGEAEEQDSVQEAGMVTSGKDNTDTAAVSSGHPGYVLGVVGTVAVFGVLAFFGARVAVPNDPAQAPMPPTTGGGKDMEMGDRA